MVDQTSTTRRRVRWLERVRHVAWSGLIALALSLPALLDPIDQIAWLIEANVVSQPASGEIVFVGAEDDLADPRTPQARQHLATLIRRLDEAGAEEVYVNVVFDQASSAEADEALNTALRDFSGSAFLVRYLDLTLNGEKVLRENQPRIANDVDQVGLDSFRNYLGYTWYMPFSVSEGSETLSNLPASIAGVSGNPGEIFPVDYNFDLSSIPTHRFSELLEDDAKLSSLSGKKILIGQSVSLRRDAPSLPGHGAVSDSIVSIYAAETLKAGHPRYISGLLTLLATLAALLLICPIKNRTRRVGCI